MKIYLHDTKTHGQLQQLCQSARLSILTPREVKRRKKIPVGVDFFLDEVDLLILEITHPTPDLHFILAQAILADKPTLCVYAKNQSPHTLLSYIKRRPAPRAIKTFSYTEKSLPGGLQHFLELHDKSLRKTDDLASIKFTLRLTPRIDRYLDVCTEKHHKTKADYIRDLLEEE